MIEDRLNNRIKLSNKILLLIAKIDELKGRWHGSLTLNPRILGQLKRSVIITSTGASTRIEGSKMSDADVDRFLRGLHMQAPQGRDQEEVAGYADILGRIFDNHSRIKVTEGGILQLHELLLQFSTKDTIHRGKYKREDNTVAIVEDGEIKTILFNPTPPWLVKKEMDDVLTWMATGFEDKEMHPLVIIANFIFEFLAIHPFTDGNGRLSRALTNLLLLQRGYAYVPYVSLEEIIEHNQADYYSALRQTQKNHKTEAENIEPWLVFFLTCILTQTKQALALLEGSDALKLLSTIQKQVYDYITHNSAHSVSEIQNATGIALSTVKQVLVRLLALRLIEKQGQGPATRYNKVT